MLQVNLRDVNDLASSAREIMQCNTDIHERCKERISQIEKLLCETENEEQYSNGLLQMAKAAETIAFTALVAAEARLASALTAEATAIASANPIAIAAASAEVFQATNAFNQAREAHEIAKKHRELMEQRYELAVKCVHLSKSLLEQLRGEFNFALLATTELSYRGSSRIVGAVRDITKYLAEHQPQQWRYLQTKSANRSFNKDKIESKKIAVEDGDSEFEKWDKYEPQERKPVFPDEIRERLNCSIEVQKALLAFLCANDMKFRELVKSYREQAKETNNRKDVELKIRKNMAGRLGEEIVLHALKPYGEEAITQNRFVTDDGSYTKTDLIIKNLKVPVIIGRGEGNGVLAGQNLAVEVKCGSPSYIRSQEKHLLYQAIGHQASEVSCTICSRDIRNIPKVAQEELREKLREAGSPMIGMLPQKTDLDKACIDFVYGE